MFKPTATAQSDPTDHSTPQAQLPTSWNYQCAHNRIDPTHHSIQTNTEANTNIGDDDDRYCFCAISKVHAHPYSFFLIVSL